MQSCCGASSSGPQPHLGSDVSQLLQQLEEAAGRRHLLAPLEALVQSRQLGPDSVLDHGELVLQGYRRMCHVLGPHVSFRLRLLLLSSGLFSPTPFALYLHLEFRERLSHAKHKALNVDQPAAETDVVPVVFVDHFDKLYKDAWRHIAWPTHLRESHLGLEQRQVIVQVGVERRKGRLSSRHSLGPRACEHACSLLTNLLRSNTTSSESNSGCKNRSGSSQGGKVCDSPSRDRRDGEGWCTSIALRSLELNTN